MYKFSMKYRMHVYFDSFTYICIEQGGPSLTIQNQPWVRKTSRWMLHIKYFLNKQINISTLIEKQF